MADKKNGRLEEAIAILIQNQAAFVAQLRETEKQTAEIRRETAERFARIEALLIEHNRMLEALPDAVREKIGIKAAGRKA